ncbi:GNAT family N-acetyltransferase [Lacticigenium naphthae]|uniref:GNAT family N-acetyltransferase n=1 Tax=Lacticigenium naphthae TaxID=515351 RepID=UPI000403618B|nr:GNAT family N-acetyltransferase [Lacticigenium naphthae]
MWSIKAFDDLTVKELHAIYRERVAVFVVEQTCPYPEVDDLDLRSLHIFKMEAGQIQAYARLIIEPTKVAIGRVLVQQSQRGTGLGDELLKRSLDYILTEHPDKKIELAAQTYIQSFYEKHGFQSVGESFLEDDIPHIQMVYVRKPH